MNYELCTMNYVWVGTVYELGMAEEYMKYELCTVYGKVYYMNYMVYGG